MCILFIINIGRLHPLFIHLPIGILYFVFFLYVFQLWKKQDRFNDAIIWGLGMSLLTSIMAVTTGLLLSEDGGYDEAALNWHKYVGIAMAVGAAILFGLSAKRQYFGSRVMTAVFVVVVALLTMTGHFGGNLTHGADYLFTTPDEEAVVIDDIEKALVYQDIIHPILNRKCMSCHNPSKLKGELLMTTYENLMKGGENGKIIDLEDPARSAMLQRIHLPLDDKKHMPPKGKRQMEDQETALLSWWIENKACPSCITADLPQNEKIAAILSTYGKTEVDERLAHLKPVPQDQLQSLFDQGFDVQQMAVDNPFLMVKLRNNVSLKDKSLSPLQSIQDNILELDLGGSDVTDEMTQTLASFSNIEKIQLHKTAISDASLEHLLNLPYLQSLNLYDTQVTDAGLNELQKCTSLQRLYLWLSQVTDAGVADFIKARPEVNVNYKIEDSMFGRAPLSEPQISTPMNVFVDAATVTMRATFEGSTIYYTLDGSEPDSTSTIYTGPFTIDKTTFIQAYVAMDGWLDSPIASKQLTKTGRRVRSIDLVYEPALRYKVKGAQVLVDLRTGTKDFNDGHWLGWEGNHLEAVLDLGEVVSVASLNISTLSDPGSWIFYPRSIEVAISQDGNSYKKMERKSIPVVQRSGREMRVWDIAFEPSDTRYVKLKVESLLKNPSWHTNPGEKCWIFVDEIFVN